MKIIQDEFYTLLKNRKYDITKFKFININNYEYLKVCFEGIFASYIDCGKLNKSYSEQEIKTWYAYRIKVLNDIRYTVENIDSLFDIVCIVNVNKNNYQDSGKCIESLKSQKKRIFIVLLVSNIDGVRLAINYGVDFHLTVENDVQERIKRGLNYVKLMTKAKTVMICNDYDIFTDDWAKIGFGMIRDGNYDVVGRDSGFVVDSVTPSVSEFKLKVEDFQGFDLLPIVDGMMFSRKYLLRVNHNIFGSSYVGKNALINLYSEFSKIINFNIKIGISKNTHVIIMKEKTTDSELFKNIKLFDLKVVPKFNIKLLDDYVKSINDDKNIKNETHLSEESNLFEDIEDTNKVTDSFKSIMFDNYTDAFTNKKTESIKSMMFDNYTNTNTSSESNKSIMFDTNIKNIKKIEPIEKKRNIMFD